MGGHGTGQESDAVVTMRLLIHGRVQGVGYRAWCMQTARRLGVSGWVRNLADGSVEAVAHGSAVAVETFVGACEAGPSLARVTAVNTATLDTLEEEPIGFQHLPTG